MLRLSAIVLSAEAATYLLNLVVVVSFVCGMGLLAVRACQQGSAPLRHEILVWTLALILLSPATEWLAWRNGLALVQLTVAGQPDVRGAAVANETDSDLSDTATTQLAGTSDAANTPPFALPREPFATRPRSLSSGRSDALSPETPRAQAAESEESRSAESKSTESLAVDFPVPAWWQVAASLVALLWAVGAVVGLFRLGLGCVTLARFCRRLDPLINSRQKLLAHKAADAVGLRVLPPVFLSRSVSVPVSIGLLNPLIVLPEAMAEEMDEAQCQAVLLHEMAHIARRDLWIGFGHRIATVFFWWNPLVHWACNEISELREEICDNYVVKVQGEGRRLAQILVDLAARAAVRPLLPSTIGVLEPNLAGLTGRVARLVNQERNMETRMNFRTKMFMLTCGLAVLLGMASIGGLRLVYAQPAKDTQSVGSDLGAKVGAKLGAVVGAAVAADVSGTNAEHSSNRFEFRGQVLDPDGKPLPGAKIYIIFRNIKQVPPPKIRATSGSDGKFDFTMEKSEFDSLQFNESWSMFYDMDLQAGSRIVAVADGYGPQWLPAYAFDESGEALKLILQNNPEDAQYMGEKPKPVLRVVKDDVPLVGRIVDTKGRPVPRAKVSVRYIEPSQKEDLTDWLHAMEQENASYVGTWPHLMRVYRPNGSWGDPISYIMLPQVMPTATSDAEGRFRLTGIGRERLATLLIEGPGIETSFETYARTRPGPTLVVPHEPPIFSWNCTFYGANFEHVARPSIPIVGTVRDKDTGKPLPGVTIQAEKRSGNPAPGYEVREDLHTTTDAEGRYRLTGMPIGNDNALLAVPSQDQPYLMSKKTADTMVDKDSLQMDIELKRGILISGKITDAKTGEPVLCCNIDYYVFLDNPHSKSAPGFEGAYALGSYPTDKDGRYTLPGLPGRGIVGVRGWNEGEIRYPLSVGAENISELLNGVTTFDKVAPRKLHVNNYLALVEINPAEGTESVELDFKLDPGQTLTGIVLDQAGKPLAGAFYSGLTEEEDWRPLSDHKFTINCYRPEHPRTLLFVHLERKLAGSLIVQGEQKVPLNVLLKPWGVITGRVVDADGKPIANMKIRGDNFPKYLWQKGPSGQFQYQYKYYPTDQEGRFRIEGLAPGIKYSPEARDLNTDKFLGELVSDVTVESGQTKDLGDLTPKWHKRAGDKNQE